jgi:hypothetical protein
MRAGWPNDVAGRVDARGGRSEALVDPDASATVCLHAGIGQAEPFHVASTADRVQHDLWAEILSVHAHDEAIEVAADRFHLRAKDESSPRAPQVLRECVRELAV